jgi:hypothetical protein
VAEFSKEIKALVSEKLNRLESVPNAFLSSMEKIQRTKFKDVVSLLDMLDYEGGSLVVSEANLLRVEALVDEIKGVLTGSEFEKALGGLMGEFEQQAVLNYAYFETVDAAFAIPQISSAIVKERQAATIASLLDSTNQYLSNPTREAIASSIQSGGSRQDLIDTLRLLVQGDKDIDGRLLRSTRLIVSDAFALNDAAVSESIADNLGLEWYFYTGGTMDTTRCFCRERNAKFYHKTEVEKWGALDKKALGKCYSSKYGWQGRMPNTDKKTIFLTRGGYNCQHSLLPVSEEVVPPEVVNRVFGGKGNNVKIKISNNSGFDLDIKSINQHARLKANEYGLTDNFVIEISKSENVGGGVSFKKVSNDLSKFDNKVEIYTDGTLTKKQYNQIINHELRHVQQGQLDRLQMRRNKSGRWDLYWEGKKYMSATEYERLTKRITNPRLSAPKRYEAFKKYSNLPWEKEAFDNDGTF